ncbi:hypothetical protein D3C71_515390 [compost metagenome]
MPLKEVLETLVVQIVGAAFDTHHLFRNRAEAMRIGAELVEQRDGFRNKMRRLDHLFAHLPHQRIEARLFEQPNGLHRLVHHVDRIIHRLDQILDVAAIERGDEAATNRKQYVAGNVVRTILECDDALAIRLDILSVEKLAKRFGRLHDGPRMFGKHVEELVFARHQLPENTHHGNNPCCGTNIRAVTKLS